MLRCTAAGRPTSIRGLPVERKLHAQQRPARTGAGRGIETESRSGTAADRAASACAPSKAVGWWDAGTRQAAATPTSTKSGGRVAGSWLRRCAAGSPCTLLLGASPVVSYSLDGWEWVHGWLCRASSLPVLRGSGQPEAGSLQGQGASGVARSQPGACGSPLPTPRQQASRCWLAGCRGGGRGEKGSAR